MQVTKWSGKPITQPGWYSGIPIETYHSAGICDGKAVSSSDLRTCWSRSPAHMFAEWAENPNREERTITNAMLLGGCAHYLLLGEDNFRLKYIAEPEVYRDLKTAVEKPWSNNANACRDWHKRQREAGKNVVKVKMLQDIMGMARSLALEPLVQNGMLKGHIETSGFFRHQETGLWIKVRPDVVPTDGPDFVDLKTAREVTTPALQYALREHGYNQQGALIWEACEALGQPFQTFSLLYAETSSPYCTRPAPLSDRDLKLGRYQNLAMLRLIAACIDADHFPGPGEGELSPIPMSNEEAARITARLVKEFDLMMEEANA